MNRWIDELSEIVDAGEECVLVSIAGVRGSAPREVGAKMIVTATETIGTIGGGRLEYRCTRSAVELLRSAPQAGARTFARRFPLGAEFGQCCGGVVDVLFEHIAGDGWVRELGRLRDGREPVVVATGLAGEPQKHLVTAERTMSFGAAAAVPPGIRDEARRLLSVAGTAKRSESRFLLEPVLASGFNVAIFGAGHVGAATVELLSKLDCSIRWIDGRRNVFPSPAPANVTCIESEDPAREVMAMPAGAYYLVMTHSHPIDFDVCRAILERRDAAYCGLIGSRTKRRRFEKLARGLGTSDAALRGLTCPIGIGGRGKKPAEVAIAVAAQLLEVRDAGAGAAARGDHPADNVHAL